MRSSMVNKARYIISTGWWCNCDGDGEVDPGRTVIGSKEIRTKDFFLKWYSALAKFTNAEKIIIVDSNSPVKPDIPMNDGRLEFLSLNENAGHATNLVGDWCGYTRGVLMGMAYALSCRVDYWVYIEQDALIYGEQIVEKAIANMSADFMFGSGKGTPQVLQQSFMVMKCSFIPIFIRNYSRIKSTDNEMSPETKFALATIRFSYLIPEFIFRDEYDGRFFSALRKFLMKLIKARMNKSALPFGYGRSRPINFDDSEYYFQHGTKEELNTYEHSN